MSDKFYVHIVESPAPYELLDGITEGKALCSFLDIADIPYLYNLVVDLDHFKKAMTDRVSEGIKKFQKAPILHISTHGGQEGIQLTNQYDTTYYLSWSNLAEYLLPIHESLGRNLGVCMSCCGGSHGTQMAEVTLSNLVPFRWIIGTSTKIKVPDAALAYSIFYRRLYGGVYGKDLLNAVRAGSGINEFGMWESKPIQENYLQNIRQQNIQRILSSLSSSASYPYTPSTR